MNRKLQVDAIYKDFNKALDKINTQIMFNKHAEVGVSEFLLRWFQSYLSNRYQAIRIGQHSSDFSLITSVFLKVHT